MYKLPAIPEPGNDLRSVADSVRALKLAVDTLSGSTGGDGDRASRLYVQDSNPVDAPPGSAWVNTSQGNALYALQGSEWVKITAKPAAGDTLALSGATIDGSTITGSTFTGTISGSTIGTSSIALSTLSGTATGTYTLGGTPTINAPVLSGTITGTYTLGGTPTLNGSALVNTSVALTKLSATGTRSASTYLAGDDTFKSLPQGITATVGSAPYYAARAWVSFNGTGTPAIRGSQNVTSITDNGTGNYTVNFTTAMNSTNYCVNAFTGNGGANTIGMSCFGSTITTTTFELFTNNTNAAAVDVSYVFLAFFE